MSYKLILWRDLVRCPYDFRHPKYLEWVRKDNKRIDAIIESRKELLNKSYDYLIHEDDTVKDMAKYVIMMLEDRNDRKTNN